MNNAFATDGSGEGHVHYHFKPRYAEPVVFAGETFMDHQFGHYITQKHPHLVSPEVNKAIKNALRARMN